MSLAVVGAGAWGTALAIAWASAGTDVTLLARDDAAADRLDAARENARYLPDIAFPDRLTVTADPASLAAFDCVALVVPAQALATVLEALAPHIAPDATLVLCAKGIERGTMRTPLDIAADALPGRTLACLSGPSFAHDVARGLPTAVTLAATNMDAATRLAARLATPTLRFYASDDPVGVELGGALKNVMAVAVGITRGLQLGASAEAALVARGFAEMMRLTVACGGRADTLTGLSGLGDLVLTCGSPQSRNFAYGAALGRGEPLDGRPLAEGVHTAAQAQALAARHGVAAPIIDAVCAVLDGSLSPTDAVTRLLARPLTRETHPQEPPR